MPINLFILPTASTDALSGLKAERSDYPAPGEALKPKAAASHAKDRSDNFLTTLKLASNRRDRMDESGTARKSPPTVAKNRAAGAKDRTASQGAGDVEKADGIGYPKANSTSDVAGAASGGKTKPHHVSNNEGVTGQGRQRSHQKADAKDDGAELSDDELLAEKTIANDRFSQFSDLLNILAGLGFTVSEDGQLKSPDDIDLQNKFMAESGLAKDPETLKRLMARLENAGSVPTAEAGAGLDRLQQLIAGLPLEQLALPDGAITPEGTAANSAKPLVELQALIKEFLLQAEGERTDTGCREAGTTGEEKPVGNVALKTVPGSGLAKNAGDGTFFFKDGQVLAGSEIARPAKSTGSASGPQFAAVKADTGSGNPIFAGTDSTAQGDGEPAGNNPAAKPVAQGVRMAMGTATGQDGIPKMNSVAGDEAMGKNFGIDVSTPEANTQNIQGQGLEKTGETPNSQSPVEIGRSGLRTPAMEQIVKKAVFYLKNGKTEAKIDLKPEYLGHIRMQVITEHQQVTIRIHAQLQFVKEMIENNLHQLKADLQQQGLTADKLEVSVSNDSPGHEQAQGKTGWQKAGRRDNDGPAAETGLEETILQSVPVLRTDGLAVNVDYFV